MRVKIIRDERVKIGSGPLRVVKGEIRNVVDIEAQQLIDMGVAVPADGPDLVVNLPPRESAVLLKVRI